MDSMVAQYGQHGGSVWAAWWLSVDGMVAQSGRHGSSVWAAWWLSVGSMVAQCGQHGGSVWAAWVAWWLSVGIMVTQYGRHGGSIEGQNSGLKVAQPLSQQCMSPISFPPIRPGLPNLTTGCAKDPATNNSNLGYTVVPAEYLTQLQQASGGPISENGSLASETSAHIPSTISLTRLPIMTTDSRSKKPCNCTKSQCLKLYCDCFANGEFCSNCNCTNCFNNFEHEAERFKAIKACLDRNPEAFRPKIGKGMLGEIKLRHNKGCNCKRSGCLKNYCECYEAKIMCSSICKCIGCRNYEESPERRTLMSIPDPSDMSICQPRTKLFPEIFNYRKQTKVNRERHPFTFVTWDVIDATCGCLLAQAEEAEKAYHSLSVAEHMILEEFGRCLAQILHSAWKSKELQCL
ncbi:hypothetical protein chiPu_0011499 [Chiloscyllium punctatum]|uniref:CRC domain-containing protein n=1 Tax=Chiloscyllium punctatum TaxID=137246 RepID=A0A401SRR0_CHIPU|nr:hypothetical protein [Chiloscyllium punctatum]